MIYVKTLFFSSSKIRVLFYSTGGISLTNGGSLSYQNAKILAVIPARGGSKSIPKKNLQPIDGISMVGRAALVAKSLEWIDFSIISTDDEEIKDEAKRFGLDAPFIRPAHLSDDNAASKDVWQHAWLAAEKYFGMRFDISLLLEPTSPLRLASDLNKVIEVMYKKKADAVVTLSLTPAHFTPHKTLTLDKCNKVGYYLKDGKKFSRRQDIPQYYHRNGVCYAVRREHLIDNNLLLESGVVGVIIDRPVVNIDDPIDLRIANWLFQAPSNS